MDFESYGIKGVANGRHENGSSPDISTTEKNPVNKILSKAGITPESLEEQTSKRLALMAEMSDFFADDEKMLDLAEEIFQKSEERGRPFSDHEKKVVRYGIVLADIGKTGPFDALVEDQKNILAMYCVEGVPSDKITVDDFLKTYLPQRREACTETLINIGFGPLNQTTMRDFWNAHGVWTLDIIKHDSHIPKDLMPGAIFHQILEHVNEWMVTELERLTEDFGENNKFDREEIMVILIDKYDGLIHRALIPHERAILILKMIVERSVYAQDPIFMELIELIDEIGQNHVV